MPTKDALSQFVNDALTSPTIAKTAAYVTTGVGISTIFGWLEKGVGFAAALMGLLVTVALWRKLRTERREAELRIQVLEKQLGPVNHVED